VHELPVLELAETGADVGAGDGEGLSDVFGCKRLRGKV
jgi:hypothetical protein